MLRMIIPITAGIMRRGTWIKSVIKRSVVGPSVFRWGRHLCVHNQLHMDLVSISIREIKISYGDWI